MKQERLQGWHPKVRFETAAKDILEISPTSGSEMKKALVIGDVFLRYMLANPMLGDTPT